MLFWPPSLHTASSILAELDEIIVLSAVRSEEHTNFQSGLLALHAKGWLAQGMVCPRAARNSRKEGEIAPWMPWPQSLETLRFHKYSVKYDLTQEVLFTAV